MFYVGQQVVCISRFFLQVSGDPGEYPQPRHHKVYTVSEHAMLNGDQYIALHEISGECFFKSSGFAPIDELLNEEIQELLQPQTVEV